MSDNMKEAALVLSFFSQSIIVQVFSINLYSNISTLDAIYYSLVIVSSRLKSIHKITIRYKNKRKNYK